MDLIERQGAIEALCSVCGYDCDKSEFVYDAPQDEQVILCPEHYALTQLQSAEPESTRTFVELVVEYPDPELCAYKEYKGKPYYSIKYIENGEAYVGYGTYNPEVLSQYLKKYFMSYAQPEPDIIACGDCKHWICHDKRCGYWNHGVKPLDWCCHGERRTDE